MEQKITSKQINKWADEAHEIATAKGFWSEKTESKKVTLLMLIISEMSEAIENERKPSPLHANILNFEEGIKEVEHLSEQIKIQTYCKKFIMNIKDSTEDELADTFIRIIDFMRGFNHTIAIEFVGTSEMIQSTITKEGALMEQLFITTAQICQYPIHPRQWYKYEEMRILCESVLNKALNNLIFIAENRNIDFAKHIEYKMQYNSYREFMNGKRF